MLYLVSVLNSHGCMQPVGVIAIYIFHFNSFSPFSCMLTAVFVTPPVVLDVGNRRGNLLYIMDVQAIFLFLYFNGCLSHLHTSVLISTQDQCRRTLGIGLHYSLNVRDACIQCYKQNLFNIHLPHDHI